MITASTSTPQHSNGDELGEDDEVLQVQPKLTIHVDTSNLATVSCRAFASSRSKLVLPPA